jgi:hypothetical protein
MPITFQCSACQKEIKAPDTAGGKRGKCPFCGHNCYIPAPVSEADLVPLAPIDEAEEARQERETRELLAAQRELLAASRGGPGEGLANRPDLKPEDLYHYVVNFCIDFTGPNKARAEASLTEMRKYRHMCLQAVNDFINGRAKEPALAAMDAKQVRAALVELRNRLR